MKRNVILILLSIFIVTIMFSACSVPEEPTGMYYNDQEYNLNIVDGNYKYRVNLDGSENHIATFYISANVEETIDDIRTQVNGDLIQIKYDDFIDNNYFCFLDGGKIAFFEGQSSSQTIKYELNKKYQLSYTLYIEQVPINSFYEIEFYKKDNDTKNIYCRLIKKIKLDEALLYTAKYEIVNNKFVNITREISTDSLPDYIFSSIEYKSSVKGTILGEDENINGLLELYGNNKILYVQLYDNGSFEFTYNLGDTVEEQIFNDTYKNKSFVFNKIIYSNGNRYECNSTITFDNNDEFSYVINKVIMNDEYRIDENSNLIKIKYDPQIYEKYIGTHVELNTSNNFSFANNYIVYVALDGKNMKFYEDEIIVENYVEYLHIYLVSTKEHYTCGFNYYIETGMIEWLSNEIS